MSHHQCAICWEECVESEENSITETRCNHFFHKECLDIWTANHNTCPCCRTQLSQENINETIQNYENNYIDTYNINFLNNMIIEEYISNNQNYNNNNIIYDDNINIVNLINQLNNFNNIINNENIINNFNNSENIVAINNIIHNN